MMKNKHLCLIITLFLVINSPLIAYAESTPGTITVSGGSVGSGGVEGNSTVLKGTALTVIMATLASAGITIKVAQDDYERGVGAFSYLQNKFNEWENQSSQGWANYEALNETKVGADGKLYIPEAASSVLQKFTNWLFANDDVAQLPQEGESETITINGTYAGAIYEYGRHRDVLTETCAIIQVLTGTEYKRVAYSPVKFTWEGQRKNAQGNWEYDYVRGTAYKDGYPFYNSTLPYSSNTPYDGLAIVTDLAAYFQSLNGQFVEDNNAAAIDLTGFYGETLDIPQFVDPEDTQKITVVDPGLLQVLQDGYEGSNDTNIGVQDYLDALRDLLGQQALPEEITDLPDISITGEDATTGTKEEVATIDRDTVTTPGITLPADPIAPTWPEVPPIAVPVADPDSPVDPIVAIPAMSLDLRNYFPFCIPFDIYNLLAKLNAEPVTPVVNIDWGDILGVVGINYVMTIDLHDYDGLASLLRTMELFGFVIGLGVATRSMYLRG